MKRCTSAKPESSGSGSSGSIGRDSEIARPVRIRHAAASLTWSVIRLSVPIRSSPPHRPQLDKSDRYLSTPLAVSPAFSVTAAALGICASLFRALGYADGSSMLDAARAVVTPTALFSASRNVFSRQDKSRARDVVLQNTFGR